jgi:hypothetical protein
VSDRVGGADEVSEAAAVLYRLPPEDFTSARTQRVKALRDSGDTETAKQVAALRKPTVGAWLVNLLVADEPALGEQVTALADQLHTAQEQLSGEDLRALGRQRQALVSGLVARARGLAKDAGRAVTGSVLDTEVESSLRAALADPDVAREVLSGRLTHATEFTGFGPAAGSTQPRRSGGAAPAKKTAKAAGRPETAADRKRAAKRAQLQERLRAAEEALEAAEDEHALAGKAKAAAETVLSSAEEQRDVLRTQLDQAQAAHDEAAERDEQARWRTKRAAAALKAAEAAVARARDAADRAES